VVQEKNSDKPEKTVIEQTPPAGTKAAKGDRVTIVVSKGPGTVEVPDTVGLTEADARGDLETAGFKVEVRRRPVTNESDNGLVVDQRPSPRTQLKKGRTVVIWVGEYTAPTPTDTTPATTTPTVP
jgi:serine/threonine-protein kinase